MRSTKPFVAFQSSRRRLPIIAVDIGYSAKVPSCGIAWTGRERPICLQFGKAIGRVAELCVTFEQPVLVIEAALSTFHRQSGNPDIRGRFEVGRGWYWGPGAVSTIAAARFLRELARLLPIGKRILLGEAFLSNKSDRTRHEADAAQIAKDFWRCRSEMLEDGAEPLTDLISGVPSVRVFSANGSVHVHKRLEPTRSRQRAAQA
jgi:hypothetical protein